MRTLRRITAVAGLVVAAATLGTTIDARATEHCPDHEGHPGKVEDVTGPSVTFDAGTVFCVKAGPYASGVIVDWPGGTWTTPLEWHPHGTHHIDISYYVVYRVETPEPETPEPETPEPETPEPETPQPETPEPETPQPETPQPETPQPEAPVGEQLPPPGVTPPVAPTPPTAVPATPTGPAPDPLPHTGAATAVLALVAAALVTAGAGLRRIAHR